jgi:ADP-ribosylglycohydrolase
MLLQKILGGLYGQALGDAWAMPALLKPQDTWERYGGWITGFMPGPADHPVHHGLAAGQITDDTEQAFALAKVFIQDGKVTSGGAARAVINWYDSIDGDNTPYVGPSTRRAVMAIKAGEPLNVTGRMGDTNGAAMRVSPVGLMHPGNLEAAVKDAYLSCVPTHNTDVAISGACAVAGAIAVAMQDGVTLDEIIAAGMKAADMGRQYGYTWIGASVSRRIDLAVKIARAEMSDQEKIQELYDVIGSTLAIPDSVGSAFGVLVMADGDPRQTAIYAAALSGDADTVGAMACAIAGAWKGAGAFDKSITDTLRKANPGYDFDQVAQGLLTLAQV